MVYIEEDFYSFCSISACSISLNEDIKSPQPLLLKPKESQENQAFYQPTDGDTIKLRLKEAIIVACPKAKVKLKGRLTKYETTKATCTKSGKFSVVRQMYSFEEITCSVHPRHDIRFTKKNCWKRHHVLEIGFSFNTKRFVRLMRICYDKDKHQTFYSQSIISKNIAGAQKGIPRPQWIRQCQIFDLNCAELNDLYKQKVQRAVINKQLGLNESSSKYIDRNPYYLAKGHLSARTDFLYGAQQRATFYLINAAPQWQIFNMRNWLMLETSVRKFAQKIRRDLTIYTGTYGVMTLPHAITEQEVELYLYINGTRKAIPVPRLFWKLVYEPSSKTGTVFIGVNNPYVFQESRDKICTDICDKYKWITWKRTQITLGYGYCCAVDEFAKHLQVSFAGVRVDDILQTTVD